MPAVLAYLPDVEPMYITAPREDASEDNAQDGEAAEDASGNVDDPDDGAHAAHGGEQPTGPVDP